MSDLRNRLALLYYLSALWSDGAYIILISITSLLVASIISLLGPQHSSISRTGISDRLKPVCVVSERHH